MKANKAAETALTGMLNRIYGDLYALEEAYGIRGDGNDYRPRIEYFHDAIRAWSAGDGRGKGGRLSVELLAYDVAMLRHIEANPIPKGKKSLTLSPSTALVPTDGHANAPADARAVRGRLSDAYRHYAVLFAALLCEAADKDYRDRLSECQEETEELTELQATIKAESKGQANAPVAMDALIEEHVNEPALLKKLLAALSGKPRKIAAAEALKACKSAQAASDKALAEVEKAHFRYVTGQLAVYEGAKDVVRQMAVSGMNLVGNFVESAVQEAQGGMRR